MFAARPAFAARVTFVVSAALLALAGCAGGAATNDVKSPPSTMQAGQARFALPFLHDDYAAALAEAKRTNKPIFVDAWAPWCHSCLSLREYVLTDPALTKVSGAFVWLSIDTEKEGNSAFVSRFQHAVLPTLWVIDPATEKPIMKWAGGATADELVALLSAASSGEVGAAASQAFVRGNRAVATGDLAAAEEAFRAALSSAEPGHAHRARILEALINVLSEKHDHRGCAALADAEAPRLPPGTSRAVVLALGISCASEAKSDGESERLVALALRDARGGDPRILADDRSGLFEAVVSAKEARGDKAGAKAVAADWASFLEGEAARARTKEARAVFDAHRVLAYIALGIPERAVPMLEESERDFPSDYNPPARLARVFFEMKRLDEAAAAADRAASRVYGPRAMRILALQADIARARGDMRRECASLRDAVARTEGAALTGGQRRFREELSERLKTRASGAPRCDAVAAP